MTEPGREQSIRKGRGRVFIFAVRAPCTRHMSFKRHECCQVGSQMRKLQLRRSTHNARGRQAAGWGADLGSPVEAANLDTPIPPSPHPFPGCPSQITAQRLMLLAKPGPHSSPLPGFPLPAPLDAWVPQLHQNPPQRQENAARRDLEKRKELLFRQTCIRCLPLSQVSSQSPHL